MSAKTSNSFSRRQKKDKKTVSATLQGIRPQNDVGLSYCFSNPAKNVCSFMVVKMYFCNGNLVNDQYNYFLLKIGLAKNSKNFDYANLISYEK